MCGLFGVIFSNPANQPPVETVQRLFTALAVVSADRGTDAAGMAQVAFDGRGWVYKDSCSAYEVVRRQVWKNCLSQVNSETLALLGHTRRASVGAKVAANAHPFQFVTDHGPLFGTHNGTITGYGSAFGEAPYDCDSANVFNALALRAEKDWPSVLNNLTGSFALVWARAGKVYIARNWSSPLWVGDAAFGARVYASTQHILYAGAALAHVDLSNVREVSYGDLYTIDRGLARWVRFDTPKTYSYDSTSSSLAEADAKAGQRWCDRCRKQKYSDYRRVLNGSPVCNECSVAVIEAAALAAYLRSLEGDNTRCRHDARLRLCAQCTVERAQTEQVQRLIRGHSLPSAGTVPVLLLSALLADLTAFTNGSSQLLLAGVD